MDLNSIEQEVVTTDSESSESSSEYSDNSTSSDDECFFVPDVMGLLPYQFEPVIEDNVSSDSGDNEGENSEDADENRFENTDRCACEHCQITDRVEKSVCCQEIPEIMKKNEEVFVGDRLDERPSCITDNPAFAAVCLNPWVLQVAWDHYKQQYGSRATEGPEHKKNRHIAYRQLVWWCWGTLGKDIRVPLPSCAVSSIQAHFPPPGLEEDFQFEGFHFAY